MYLEEIEAFVYRLNGRIPTLVKVEPFRRYIRLLIYCAQVLELLLALLKIERFHGTTNKMKLRVISRNTVKKKQLQDISSNLPI